jgi:pyrethroid hydrolase
LTRDGPDRYTGETFAYPKVSPRVQGQLGLWVEAPDETPVIVLANGAEEQLSPVVAEDGRTWYVEKGKWNKECPCHAAASRNRPGTLHLRIGPVQVRLEVRIPGFTPKEFDDVLEEFRDGLWQLILDPKGPTTVGGEHSGGAIGDDYLAAVREHIAHVARALDSPHNELREVPLPQPIAKVRPTRRTFQELALRGAPRLVTGRGHAPSIDTPENRELIGMTARLERAVTGLGHAASALSGERMRQAEQTRSGAATMDGRVSVYPERLEQDIAETEEMVERLRASLRHLTSAPASKGQPNRYRLKVTGVPSPDSFEYGQVSILAEWQELNRGPPPAEKLILQFDQERRQHLDRVFRNKESIVVVGKFLLLRNVTIKGVPGAKYKVVELSELHTTLERKLEQDLSDLQAQKRILQTSDWKRALSPRQRRDQLRDQQSELKRAQRFKLDSEHWRKRTDELRALGDALRPLLRRAKRLGISVTINPPFTGSMVFVQEPPYRLHFAR